MTTSNTTPAIRHVDAAIIGAGTAGHNAYRQLSKATKNIVIINEGIWSTTCTTMGCMPSKLMIAAGERAHYARDSEVFGVKADVHIDGEQVMRRVQSERDHFVSYALDNANSWDESTKIYGRAFITEDKLIEAHTSTGDVELIKADYIIVATGSKPFVPDGWKAALGDKLITSDTIFEMKDLPKSLGVVGAGAIGLELAQSMSRLGVDVTIFNRGFNIGGIKDDAINQQAITDLSLELNLKLGVSVDKVETVETASGKEQAQITFSDNDGVTQTWQGEMVLSATGRRSSVHKMGLEHLGVQFDERQRPLGLDKTTGQIGNSTLYIVGDANGYRPLLHITSNEGYLAGKEVGRLVSGKLETLNEGIIENADTLSDVDSPIINDMTAVKAESPEPLLSVIFSDPQIMEAGHTMLSLQQHGIDYAVGEVSFANQGRSRIMGVNKGMLRIYADTQTGLIMGASMVGPAGEYIGHIITTAIRNNITVEGLLDSPFYHPTILEGLRTALRDLQKNIYASNANKEK